MSFVRLKTDINGGFPLVLDDIRVLQGELSYAFYEYLDNICPADGAVWISGGSFPTTFSLGIGAGVAYVKTLNQLVNVSANTLAGWAGTTTFLRPAASTFDSAGLKTFQNGTTADTYELPRYTINTGTAQAGDIILNKWVYLFQDFDDEIVTFASGITNGNIVTLTPRAKYVSLICSQINGPAGTRNTDEDLFTINNTLFDSAQECIGLAVDGNGSYNIPISINTSGVVRARFGSVNGEYPLAFVLTYPLK
jgi:hypothetical protein